MRQGTATVVLLESGDALTTDGPSLGARSTSGGFTIIETTDLDSALEWGRKLTRVLTLPIEVRPMADAADRCDPPLA